MGVNISGKGVLSGLATLVAGAVQSFNLLVTRVIGYTNIPGTGGSSYYTTTVGSTSNGFIGIGKFSRPYYSEDGISEWKEIPELYNYGMYASTYGEYGYGAVLWNNSANNLFFAYSTNAINWQIVETSITNATSFSSIEYNNNSFIGLTPNGHLLIVEESQNGGIGTIYEKNIQGDVGLGYLGAGSIARSNDGIYAFISQQGIHSSSDLTNWTTIPKFKDQYQNDISVSQIVFFAGKFIMISPQGFYYSVDGANWVFSSQVHSNYGLQFVGEAFVGPDAVYGNIYSSDQSEFQTVLTRDGISFTPEAVGLRIYDSAYRNGEYFFLGRNSPETDPSSVYGLYVSRENQWGPVLRFADLVKEYDPYSWPYSITAGPISTLREIQVSIGDQGSGGAEILAPVDVYTVPANNTTDIDQVTVKNNSLDTITYDLGVLDSGIELTDQNVFINDQAISAGATATITGINEPMTAGQRIVVFPSAVDVVEVKVYGTETSA